jgi:uncharacterized membrane protein YhhN
MTILLLSSVCFALIDWYAVAANKKRLEYVAKPATLLALILWFALRLPSPLPNLGLWLFIGLIFSLVGDVFLMLPGSHFIKGLAAFLLAHVAYIIGFNTGGPVLSISSLLIAAAIGLVALFIVRPIVRSLRATEKQALVIPLISYAVVLSLAFWSTAATLLRPNWPFLASGLVTFGGGLFFVSDAANAWNRFVGPHPGGRLFEMVTYHLAQLALSIGVLISVGSFA